MLRETVLVLTGLSIGGAMGLTTYLSSRAIDAPQMQAARATQTPKPAIVRHEERPPEPAPPPVEAQPQIRPARQDPHSRQGPDSRPADPSPPRELTPIEREKLAALIAQLQSPIGGLRMKAAMELAEFGPAAEPATGRLLELLGDEASMQVRHSTPWGSSMDRGVATVGEHASGALAAIGAPAVPGLLKALEGSNPEVVKNAACALGELKTEQASPLLVSHLARHRGSAKHDRARSYILDALGKIGSPEAVPVLIRVLAGETDDNRRVAAESLKALKDPRSTAALCQMATSDTQQPNRWAAIEALDAIQDRAAEPTLRALCGQGVPSRVRKHAIRALTRLVGSAALIEQVAVLSDENPATRQEGANAIRASANADSVPALLALLRHANAEYRRAAAYTFESLIDPRAVEPLAAALRDPDTDVRRRAILALRAQNAGEATDAILQVAASRDDPEVRRAAIHTLVVLRAKEATEPLCRIMVRDADPALRRASFEALKNLDRRDPRFRACLEIVSNDSDRQLREKARQLLRSSR